MRQCARRGPPLRFCAGDLCRQECLVADHRASVPERRCDRIANRPTAFCQKKQRRRKTRSRPQPIADSMNKLTGEPSPRKVFGGDIEDKIGGTEFRLGTHDDKKKTKRPRRFSLRAGDALIFDYRIWHRGMAKPSCVQYFTSCTRDTQCRPTQGDWILERRTSIERRTDPR